MTTVILAEAFKESESKQNVKIIDEASFNLRLLL